MSLETVRLARNAMATRFEIMLHGENPAELRAAGEEALDEVDRLENQLSLYRPASEVARVNALAARRPVTVSPPVFDLLAHAQRLHDETGGAFDITIGPLVRCWGFMGGSGVLPEPAAVAAARELVGMNHVQLCRADFSVQFDREGVMIDLGAIGKGYAIDCAVELLREYGVTSALIHGGTSTAYALGLDTNGEPWQVGIPSEPEPKVISLRDEALSISAGWGKSFTAGGKTYGHVLDPRTGESVADSLMAAVVLPSATETDALSTALLVAGRDGAGKISRLRKGMRTFLLYRDGAEIQGKGNLDTI